MAHVLTALKIVPKQDCTEAANLARELGLEIQARRYEKPLAEDSFKELTLDEALVFGHHCPTRYVSGGGADVKALEQYGFDSVPIEVMRHWKTIKENYAFDSYEIWTTEKTPRTSDPLLIGILGHKLYLLARWGLESPEELPLSELAKAQIEEAINRIDDAGNGFGYDYGFFGTGTRNIERQKDLARRWWSWFNAAERILGLK